MLYYNYAAASCICMHKLLVLCGCSEIPWDSLIDLLLSFSPLSLDREMTYLTTLRKYWCLSEEKFYGRSKFSQYFLLVSLKHHHQKLSPAFYCKCCLLGATGRSDAVVTRTSEQNEDQSKVFH